jgi:hypothetical protein
MPTMTGASSSLSRVSELDNVRHQSLALESNIRNLVTRTVRDDEEGNATASRGGRLSLRQRIKLVIVPPLALNDVSRGCGTRIHRRAASSTPRAEPAICARGGRVTGQACVDRQREAQTARVRQSRNVLCEEREIARRRMSRHQETNGPGEPSAT